MKIKLEKLYQKAAERPPGYLEEVLAAGTVKAGYLEIAWPHYQRLLAKYGAPSRMRDNRLTAPANPPPPLRGAGDMVARIANPIARLIDRVAKTNLQNCHKCKQRQVKLNVAIPFSDRRKPDNLLKSL